MSSRYPMDFYSTVIPLLTYPGDGYPGHVKDCVDMANEIHLDLGGLMQKFSDGLGNRSLHEMEEYFTQTFDMNPVCALDIGWHLFGEDYNRGQFLAKMRRELARYEIRESNELPDHLSHALLILGKMDDEAAAKYGQTCILPALAKMIPALEAKDNAFQYLLKGILSVVQNDRGALLERGANG